MQEKGKVAPESVELEGKVKVSSYGKIMMSNVEVKYKRNLLWDRRWRDIDVYFAMGMAGIHLLTLIYAPSTFSWDVFWLAIGGYAVTFLFGISLGYHRCLSHQSYKVPKWLEYFLAYCGVQTLQRDPIFWVSMHRYHHKYGDQMLDPHTPAYGFWFSYMGWIFDTGYILDKYQERKNVEDLRSQAFYRFLKRTYFYHPLGLAILMYAIGGLPYLVWGMGVRLVLVYQFTFMVNTICHIWGQRPWNSGDLSTNVWWLGLLTFGEGWHNNHHAFAYSARHGLEWWQIDVTWYIIKFLQAVGLATNVKLPSEAHKKKLSFVPGNKLK